MLGDDATSERALRCQTSAEEVPSKMWEVVLERGGGHMAKTKYQK